MLIYVKEKGPFFHVRRRMAVVNATFLTLYLLRSIKVLHMNKSHKIKEDY